MTITQRKMDKRVRMGWRRHILGALVSVYGPITDVRRPTHEVVIADVMFPSGYGAYFTEVTRGRPAPVTRAILLARVLEYAARIHPGITLAPHAKYTDRWRFVLPS